MSDRTLRLLNLGCGGNRPQSEQWWNLDNLRTRLHVGTPERTHLDAEPRYIEHDLLAGRMPFPAQHFDGILASHVIEHFTCHEAVFVLQECLRVLKSGGVVLVSVPDVEYFLKVYPQDNRESAERLFGEPISPDEPWHARFFDYALFHDNHKQVLTGQSLTALFIKAGYSKLMTPDNIALDVARAFGPVLNREKFSVMLAAVKP